MSTELKHDPEFPYVVTAAGGVMMARFSEQWHADNYVRNYGAPSWLVTDTTPKPRIPEDAEFITWGGRLATRVDADEWALNGFRFTQDELNEEIGNERVTVLDARSN